MVISNDQYERIEKLVQQVAMDPEDLFNVSVQNIIPKFSNSTDSTDNEDAVSKRRVKLGEFGSTCCKELGY